MDCIHVLKYLNIFLTTFFTLLLAVFGGLQWRAIKEQNKQNLFRMRMRHCMKVHEIWMDTYCIIEKLDSADKSELKENLRCMINKLEKTIPESEYLFNIDFMVIEGKVIESLRKILQYIEDPQNIDENLYFKNISTTLEESATKYKSICDEFLNPHQKRPFK